MATYFALYGRTEFSLGFNAYGCSKTCSHLEQVRISWLIIETTKLRCYSLQASVFLLSHLSITVKFLDGLARALWLRHLQRISVDKFPEKFCFPIVWKLETNFSRSDVPSCSRSILPCAHPDAIVRSHSKFPLPHDAFCQ